MKITGICMTAMMTPMMDSWTMRMPGEIIDLASSGSVQHGLPLFYPARKYIAE